MLALLSKLLEGTPRHHQGVMGVYFYLDDAVSAVSALRQNGHKDLSVFSPVPHHDIERALEQGPSMVRWITLCGGILGVTLGTALCFYSVTSYPLVVGGKELISLPPFVVISYESMILLGGLANLIGLLALARLPQTRATAPYAPRFSEDRIGIWVPCAGDSAGRVLETMKGHGAEEVTLHA